MLLPIWHPISGRGRCRPRGIGAMELPVRGLTGIIVVTAVALAMASAASTAQTSDQPGQQGGSSSDGAADQLKAGAQRIGEGAERIGEGIKQGAIQGWEAVKAGAAADKLNNGSSAPQPAPAPPPPA